MQIVPQELGAGTAAVAVVDAEERAGRPGLVLPVLRLHDVEDDGDPVLVVIANQPLVGVGGVGPHDAVALVAALGRLVVGDDDAGPWSEGQSCCLLLLLVHHRIGVNNGERADLCGFTRLRINFILHVHALPIALKQLFEVLLLSNKLLASRRT